jgi:glycerophosphoryl diester phosphodiesterase
LGEEYAREGFVKPNPMIFGTRDQMLRREIRELAKQNYKSMKRRTIISTREYVEMQRLNLELDNVVTLETVMRRIR